jgi:transposase
MTLDPSQLPDDIAALKAALIDENRERVVETSRAAQIAAELAQARAKASDDAALIAHQKLQIEKLKRELYGPRGAHGPHPRPDRA